MDWQEELGKLLSQVAPGIALWLVTFGLTAIAARLRKVPVVGLLKGHWQLLVGWGALLIVVLVVYPSMGPFWTAIVVASVVAIMVSAGYEYSVTRFSGETEGFSVNRNGPWERAVACDPVYYLWKPIEGAKWIWIKKKPSDPEAVRGQTVWHKLDFWLPRSSGGLANAVLTLMVDDFVHVYVNGQLVKTYIRGFEQPTTLYLAPFLRRGNNVILMEITNEPGTADRTGETNPAGIVYVLRVA